MNALAQRLDRCKSYREEALKHPRVNALYIEDLNISIDMFEKALGGKVEVQKGWEDE